MVRQPAAINLRQQPVRVDRRAVHVALALAHCLLALSASVFLRARSQDAAADAAHVLCGRGAGWGTSSTSSSAEYEVIVALDAATPDVTRAVVADLEVWRETCDLQFAVGDDSNNNGDDDQRTSEVDESDIHSGDVREAANFRQEEKERRRRGAEAREQHVGHDHGPGLVPEFDRFLMFFTDCWPHAYADDVFKHYSEHSQVFLVNIPGAKYSHAIYTAYLTGQLPTNYEGKPIAGDHIVRSMKRSFVHQKRSSAAAASVRGSAGAVINSDANRTYPLRYIGPEWSFLAIFGKENYGTFFDAEVKIYKESLNLPFEHPYPFFFERDSDRTYWSEYTDSLVASGESMMAHTGVMDHRQHGEHRGLGAAGTSFPRTDDMAKTMQKDMSTIKDFIDAHPEYLLVLASDHGVDEFDFGGYKMHGESENGNEPFVLLYNPRLPSQGPKWIDVVDVAPTISSYLRGVDVPLNALGVTHAYFGESYAARRAEAGALKQSLVQLNKAAARRGVSVDQSRLKTLLSRRFEDDMTLPRSSNKTQLGELRQFAMAVKSDVYTIITMPLVQLSVLTISTSLAVLVVLLNYNDKLEIFVVAEDYLGFGTEMARSLVMYAICFLNLMFCWWGWGIPADGGFVFRIVSLFLCLSTMRNIHTSASTRASEGLVAASESLIFHNEMLNALLQGVTSCIPSLVSWIDGAALGPFGLVAAFVGTLAIKWHSEIYHLRDQRFLGLRESNIMIASVWSSFLYTHTSDMDSLFVSGFHIFALPTFVFGLLVFPVRFLLQRRLADLGIAVALVMHLISKDNPTRQLVLWLSVYQFFSVILPLADSVRLQMCRIQGPALKHKLSLSAQAIGIYLLNQAFFTFYFGFGDKVNFDVHPFSGAIGMQAYDTFKALSAFLMALHKYGVFVLLILASASLSQLHRLPDPRAVARWLYRIPSLSSDKHVNDSSKLGAVAPDSHLLQSYWMSDHFSALTALFGVCMGLGFFLMFSIAARYHPFEQATCTLLLSCFIGFAHVSLSTMLQTMDRCGFHGYAAGGLSLMLKTN